ncbi:FkbM family methyltransferase [Paenibacillus lycopersici]|uniref:FkbM family methyltransferase n=1 Tax=Paenibacillus lycopersici TaxID=2704462 RepID=A0A6C0FTB9_9BACL|nr:FkbM family methyltransferase [Paenibacillus lycopersici]QHT59262.1 FkbM family methyltransferase [Paenibacillus lycopersici]
MSVKMTSPIELTDGVKLYGHEDEYITSVIQRTKQYYEIIDLQKFSPYIPENAVIFDIGSNIGNHTVFFHKHCNPRRIYAFEPASDNASLLKKNIIENGLANTVVYQTAVGSTPGRADLVKNIRNMGECKLVDNPNGAIEVVSINSLKLEEPDFVKIDVEGAELEVLRGMTDILASSSPVLWIEINDNFNEVDDLLGQFQYELIDKHHFNYIYVKHGSRSNQLETLQLFKRSIIPNYNQLVLDKWNLNRWLAEEKDKNVKLLQQSSNLELDLKNSELALTNAQFELGNLGSRSEREISTLQQEVESLNNRMHDSQVESKRLVSEHETEISSLLEKTANLTNSLEETRRKLINTCNEYEIQKKELHEHILQHIEAERKALLEMLALQQHYQLLEARYMRVRNTLPGKVAVKLLKFVKRLRRKRDFT